MSGKRGRITVGAAAGLIWSVALIWGAQTADLPFIPAPVALPTAFIAPGILLILLIGRISLRRFSDDALIDGEPFEPGSGAARDQRVLSNTVEQLVLALLVWPFIAFVLGGALVIAMGVSFAGARLLFWVGYHRAPSLRALGFAAGFYPTVLGAIWSVLVWFV